MQFRRFIRERMPVCGSDGRRFATVDRLEGADVIKVTEDERGRHRWIPLDWVARVDRFVHLNRTAAQAMQHWLRVRPVGHWREALFDERIHTRNPRRGTHGS